MAIIENELRDLLRDRGDDLPVAVTSAPGRLDDVRGRIVRRRRQRTAAGGVVATLAVAVGALGWAGAFDGVLPHRHDSLPAVPSPLPEYAGGGRLITSMGTDRPVGSRLAVSVVVPDAGLMVRTSCDGEGRAPQVQVAIGGRPIGEMTCGSGATFSVESLATAGVEAGGGPVEVSASVGELSPCQDCTPWSGRIDIGLYEPVPRAQYHFPPRPDPVPAVESLAELSRGGRQVVGVEGRTVGADGDCSLQVRSRAGRQLVLQASAPGVLTVTINGRQVGVAQFWDYLPSQTSIDLSPETLKGLGLSNIDGQILTVRLAASGFGDPSWVAWVDDDSVHVAVPDPRP